MVPIARVNKITTSIRSHPAYEAATMKQAGPIEAEKLNYKTVFITR